jgi:hypothetical protein
MQPSWHDDAHGLIQRRLLLMAGILDSAGMRPESVVRCRNVLDRLELRRASLAGVASDFEPPLRAA